MHVFCYNLLIHLTLITVVVPFINIHILLIIRDILILIIIIFKPECPAEAVEEAKMQEPRGRHARRRSKPPFKLLFIIIIIDPKSRRH